MQDADGEHAMTTAIPMLDLMFFLTESVDNPRHVGAVQIFRLPPRGGAARVREIVDAYRRMKPQPPFNRVPVFQRTGMPQWREVDAVDSRYHVMHLALPAPGTDEQLHQLVADLHAPMLERHRPGWKVYVIEGLAGNRFAIYHKVHHALVDGESGMAILERALSTSAGDRKIRTTVGVKTKPRLRPVPQGLREAIEKEALSFARRTLSIGRGSMHLVEETLQGLRGFSKTQYRAFTAPHTPMNDPIHNARAVTHTVFPLQAMKAVSRARQCTLNDVALCVVDAGLNRYLRAMGRSPDRPLVAICPVSLHDPGAKVATTNVSAIWPPLGAASSPVGERLATITAHTRAAKAELKGLGKGAAYAYAVMAFAMSETLVISKPEMLGLLPANVLISNVRGPEHTLYLNGARLEALFPVSTLIAGVGLNVTFMSYGKQVIMGFTANGAALPEVESLARYVQDAFAELRA
jgi:diacylglycerol O-acyltransferase / wax synthase